MFLLLFQFFVNIWETFRAFWEHMRTFMNISGFKEHAGIITENIGTILKQIKNILGNPIS